MLLYIVVVVVLVVVFFLITYLEVQWKEGKSLFKVGSEQWDSVWNG